MVPSPFLILHQAGFRLTQHLTMLVVYASVTPLARLLPPHFIDPPSFPSALSPMILPSLDACLLLSPTPPLPPPPGAVACGWPRGCALSRGGFGGQAIIITSAMGFCDGLRGCLHNASRRRGRLLEPFFHYLAHEVISPLSRHVKLEDPGNITDVHAAIDI